MSSNLNLALDERGGKSSEHEQGAVVRPMPVAPAALAERARANMVNDDESQ